MPDWRYVDPADHDVTKLVNNCTCKCCKHCMCRATEKMRFFTNHSSSEHTFPCNRPAASAVTNATPTSGAPACSHSAVEESANLGNDDGGFGMGRVYEFCGEPAQRGSNF